MYKGGLLGPTRSPHKGEGKVYSVRCIVKGERI